MTKAILSFDPNTGRIERLEHVVDHDYTPGEGEVEVEDPSLHKEVNLEGKRVNTSGTGPVIEDDPEYVSYEAAREQYRTAVQSAREAHEAGNAGAAMAEALDALTELGTMLDKLDARQEN